MPIATAISPYIEKDGADSTYSLEELRVHNQEDDAWIAVEGYVYDVTTFLGEHPGGKEIILEHLGKDATDVFTSESMHAHSQSAFKILSRYCIGVLKDSKVVNRSKDSKFDKLVDITKPLFPQLPKLGRDYNDWLHSQFGLQKIIIFDNWFETFTRWPWWYIFIMWLPFDFYMLKNALQHVSVAASLNMFIVGLLSWSIVEYTLHRFVFHIYTYSTNWNIFHFFAHGIHHLTPNDSTRLTFPPMFNAVICVLVTQLPRIVAPSTGVHAWIAGITFGFMLYDAIHYYFHHGDAPWLPDILKKMK